jgi:3-oxoacyl-[acyl-carrier-protein] synthase-3
MKIQSYIDKIEFIVPNNKLSNDDLVKENPSWEVDKIYSKTGIHNRYIADCNTTSTDLAVEAGISLFNKYPDLKNEVDYLIFCTQSPDFFLPTSACLIQERIGLRTEIGAIDINQGCSGFVYALSLAKGMIESQQVKNVLIITSETYSKYINNKDKSVRTLFGDAACCTFIQSKEANEELINKVIHGTDGSGAEHLIVPHGAQRNPINESSFVEEMDTSKNLRSPSNLYMNGGAIYTFTLTKIPKVFNQILDSNDLTIDDLDLVIFHQANKFILDAMQRKLKIPDEKMHRSYMEYGNTVCSTIPIGIKIEQDLKSESEKKIALILGFGVGLSWAGTIIKF